MFESRKRTFTQGGVGLISENVCPEGQTFEKAANLCSAEPNEDNNLLWRIRPEASFFVPLYTRIIGDIKAERSCICVRK
jgi:hypothetical protein